MDNYNKETENILLEMVKQKQEADKRLLALEWVIAILSCIVILTPALIAPFLPIKEWQQALVVFSGFIPALIGFGFAIRIEQIAGYYECKYCKHKHVPTFKQVTFAAHVGRTRYMKCPNCNTKSWQKKVISKD